MLNVNGVATVRHEETGQTFDIPAEAADVEQVGGEERNMGDELVWEVAVHHEDLGELTWTIHEYPIGILNHTSRDLNGHELVTDFDMDCSVDDLSEEEE